MLLVDNIGDLNRTVEYTIKVNGKPLKDHVTYAIAEVAKPPQQKPVLDDDGNPMYDEGLQQMRGETIPEWVERVTRGAKLFQRDGIELSALEATQKYDDMGGIVMSIFKAIQENEGKN
jgi:hypothetical protein